MVRTASRVLVAIVALMLVACGGGDPLPASPPAGAVPMEAKLTPADPRLAAGMVERVNATTAGIQLLRDLGTTPGGGYAVVWTSDGPAMYLRQFDATGAPAGGEVPLAFSMKDASEATAALALASADAAVLTDGSVVVAYRFSRFSALPNGVVQLTTGVYLQRFDATGSRLLDETEVASRTEVPHSRSPQTTHPRVIALSDGGFAVAWTVTSFSAQFGYLGTLSVQRFDAQGRPQGAVISHGGAALEYGIAADAQGGFMLQLSTLDSSFRPLTALVHYDAALVAQTLRPASMGPAFALALASGYVLFESDTVSTLARRLDAQGNPVGTATPAAAVPVAARALGDGTHAVILPGGSGLLAQRVDADGLPLGPALPIDASGPALRLAALAGSEFVLAWTATVAPGDTDVLAQHFLAATGDRKKECQAAAKALKGREHQGFMRNCLGRHAM